MSTLSKNAGRERGIALRWLAAGVIFGALFPLTGWFLATRGAGVVGLAAAHQSQPVLYLVDLAPFVLGAVGLGVGVFHVRLVRIRRSIEHTVQERTADLRQALHELSDTQAELLGAQKLEAIGGLAAGIAHEINTPIQYVGDNTRFVDESLADLLEVVAVAAKLAEAASDLPQTAALAAAYEEAANDADIGFLAAEIPTAIAESLDGIAQVASIVQALKSFAHPGTEDKSPADLNEMIASTAAVARNEWKYVAEMDLDGLDPELPAIPVLSGPLKQVLLNLIVNAAHAIEEVVTGTDGKGAISISTAIVGSEARIDVADTGIGMSDEIRERIFEPFFTTKEVGKGSGQGLAVARSIIDKHGGRMAVASTPGAGTTFSIYLPLASDNVGSDRALAHAVPSG